jgi:hypothetical protein
MNSSDSYRVRAADLRAKAAKEPNKKLAAEYHNLARCYTRLAEQADSNRQADIWLEVGPKLRLNEDDGA